MTRFKKTWLPCTIINIRNTNFNYLKYCSSGRKTDSYLQGICHDSIAVYKLSIHQLLSGQLQLTELLTTLDSFYQRSLYHQHPYRVGWWGRGGSHKVVCKGYVNSENSHMASIGVIFTSKYHKAAKFMTIIPPSRVVNNSWLSACHGEMEPFEDYLSTHGYLTSIRNKPQQAGQLSVSMPY